MILSLEVNLEFSWCPFYHRCLMYILMIVELEWIALECEWLALCFIPFDFCKGSPIS